MLLVIGRVRCRAEQRDDLVALMQEMQDNSRREEGCVRYGFFAAVEVPRFFAIGFVERLSSVRFMPYPPSTWGPTRAR